MDMKHTRRSFFTVLGASLAGGLGGLGLSRSKVVNGVMGRVGKPLHGTTIKPLQGVDRMGPRRS